MQQIQDALNELSQAIGELEKRLKAKNVGTAIGNALGTAVGIWRSEIQIDSMSLVEIDGWAVSVAAFVAPDDNK